MTKVRDRYDTGKRPPTGLDALAAMVRKDTQSECEVHAIINAQEAVHAGTAGPFAVDLLATLAQVRAEEEHR